MLHRIDVLVSGDDDLLSLGHPPAGLRIRDPRTFVDEVSMPNTAGKQ